MDHSYNKCSCNENIYLLFLSMISYWLKIISHLNFYFQSKNTACCCSHIFRTEKPWQYSCSQQAQSSKALCNNQQAKSSDSERYFANLQWNKTCYSTNKFKSEISVNKILEPFAKISSMGGKKNVSKVAQVSEEDCEKSWKVWINVA